MSKPLREGFRTHRIWDAEVDDDGKLKRLLEPVKDEVKRVRDDLTLFGVAFISKEDWDRMKDKIIKEND